MPENPLKEVLQEMADQLQTRTLDLADIRRRQTKGSGELINDDDLEPGQPDSVMAED